MLEAVAVLSDATLTFETVIEVPSVLVILTSTVSVPKPDEFSL